MAFGPQKFDIQGEQQSKLREIQEESTNKLNVSSYSYPRLKETGSIGYEKTKKKFGPLAATDRDRKSKTVKDSKFALNELIRDPLSVEAEERREIERRVNEAIERVKVDAEEAARKIGYDEGFAAGKETAFDQFKSEYKEKYQQFSDFVKQCEEAKEIIFKENEQFLIDLVFQISKTVLLKELSVDRDYILRLAKELVERVGVKENITLKIGRRNKEMIDKLKETLNETFGTLRNLNIEASDGIDVGCYIETEWNMIDATIESQLKGLADSLTFTNENEGGKGEK